MISIINIVLSWIFGILVGAFASFIFYKLIIIAIIFIKIVVNKIRELIYRKDNHGQSGKESSTED